MSITPHFKWDLLPRDHGNPESLSCAQGWWSYPGEPAHLACVSLARGLCSSWLLFLKWPPHSMGKHLTALSTPHNWPTGLVTDTHNLGTEAGDSVPPAGDKAIGNITTFICGACALS